MTGAVALAPAASAQTPEPAPSASVDALSAAGNGGVTILTKDPVGDVLAGAAFILLDSSGRHIASGTTNAEGRLAFQDLAPGVYRLKEVSSGSPLHEVVDDQDVIVTPGADTPLAITDPFKPAHITFKARDSKTGKVLPGSTVNIGTGDRTLLTLTTGPKGTASGKLPISSRTTQFWAKETKAPSGYALNKPAKTFTARPGAPVTVIVTHSKATTGSSLAPSEKATDQPTSTATTQGDKTAGGGTSARPAHSAVSDTDSSLAADVSDGITSATQAGSLAHTGADASRWLVGGAGFLVASGIGILVAARARRTDENAPAGED
ncbi:collagen binding domain-containing protein [Streptomyces sp. NPDC091280]|uniref:MSCRAMM family protein n=1 Tax=Streptomyces sp. NPDC091280 TaxID=3365984 RepID=UPI00380C6D22